MTPSGINLLDRILAFEFDEGREELTFQARLARENGWSHEFAGRVLGEYKRFVFMAMTAGHPVTPSDQVDQAWHLHLTYTHSYWDKFCGETLGKPLHHNPTQGGKAEGEKFDQWYNRTKESYLRLFGQPPPEDIWPAASIRFGADLHFQRVNSRKYWFLPKPAQAWKYAIPVLLLLGLLPSVQKFTSPGEAKQGTLADASPIIVSVIVILIVLFIALGVHQRNKCPKCKKIQALERTGEKKKGGFFKPAKARWKCKYCGHTAWFAINNGGYAGSAGCGSDSGCAQGGVEVAEADGEPAQPHYYWHPPIR